MQAETLPTLSIASAYKEVVASIAAMIWMPLPETRWLPPAALVSVANQPFCSA